MMTDKVHRRLLVICWLLVHVLLGQAQATTIKRMGPGFLASYSQSIVIVRVERLWPKQPLVEGEVIEDIRGEIPKGERITLICPGPDPAERWLPDREPLEVGSCVLAYLREKRGEDWWPVAAWGDAREPDDDDWRMKALWISGAQGWMEIGCEEASEVSRLFGRFMQWDGMETEERSGLIAESLMSDCRSMRWIALKWITLDRKVGLSNPEEATDGVAEGLVSCATDPDLEIRRMALRAITTTTAARKDLVPYLVDALGDDAVKAIAVSGLEWRIMRKGDGPTVSATAEIDVKVQAWKDWWKEKGRDVPEFKRFVPSAMEDTGLAPQCPGE